MRNGNGLPLLYKARAWPWPWLELERKQQKRKREREAGKEEEEGVVGVMTRPSAIAIATPNAQRQRAFLEDRSWQSTK